VQIPPSAVTLIVLAPLIAWRGYARVRRNIGRQPLSSRRPWVTLALYPAITVLLISAAASQPARLEILALCLFLGAALGVFGLSKTMFESTPEGRFYTPNAHIGVALSVLFIGRILYRVIEMAGSHPGAHGAVPGFAQSPSTLAIFGLLAGYFTTYAIGLLRHRH
jgi:hypothetical protein